MHAIANANAQAKASKRMQKPWHGFSQLASKTLVYM